MRSSTPDKKNRIQLAFIFGQFLISKASLNYKISALAIHVCRHIFDIIDLRYHSHKEEYCSDSLSQVASCTRLSKSSVRRCIAELEAIKFIRIQRNKTRSPLTIKAGELFENYIPTDHRWAKAIVTQTPDSIKNDQSIFSQQPQLGSHRTPSLQTPTESALSSEEGDFPRKTYLTPSQKRERHFNQMRQRVTSK